MDNEVSGTGNVYDYGFRIYNPRIAKFLSVDPLTKSYPELTPYQFASNTPIQAIDLDGLEAIHYYYAVIDNKKGYEMVAKVVDEKQLKRSVSLHFQKDDGTWDTRGVSEGSYYDPVHMAKRLFRPRGINIWGMGSPDGWTLGRKAAPEDVWGNFDFKAFMEIMNPVLLGVKSKKDWEIKTKPSSVKKRILKENKSTYLNPEKGSVIPKDETTLGAVEKERDSFVSAEGTNLDSEGSHYSKVITTKDTTYKKVRSDGTSVPSTKEEFVKNDK